MHRAHNYRHLIARWQAVCRAAGVRLRRFAEAGKYGVYYLQTRGSGPAVYVSAGIHGDEPAGPEGLVSWAEENPGRLRAHALLIFPCLNPWGLVNNIRVDADGRDLNRSFHVMEHPLIAGWHKVMEGRAFEAAVMLHEDYDGEGFYLYEIQRQQPSWGAALLHAASGIIPVEPRARVDRYTARAGIIRRKIGTVDFASFGYPEAVWLHLHHSERTFTIESPSEFALAQRAAAHRAAIEATLAAVSGLAS
jgi:protein MpaA